MINPALRWQPIGQRTPIVLQRDTETLLNWLERTGRFMATPIEVDPRLLEDDALADALDNSYDIVEEDEEEDQEF